jgi:virginiamycin B lyase
MRTRSFLLIASACSAMALFLAGSDSLRGQSPTAATLRGQVSSKEEGPMEGVLVSAKKADSTISVTVVSDEQGRYQFSAGRLEPGRYSLRIRAIGYDLESSNTVEIIAQQTAMADLKLRKATNMASQLTNADWLMSFPGTEEQKGSIRGCTHCHTLELIARSTHDVDEFVQVIDRMSRHTPESFPLLVQPHSGARVGNGDLTPDQVARQQQIRVKQAQYLASLNLSSTSQWEYPFKTLPRPKGRGTHVVITEYDLPKRTRQPHDVLVDSQGNAWYASFGEAILGKVDPKTGKVTEYTVPVVKPGNVIGTLDMEFDKDENLWLAMTFQGAIVKFDRKTEKFQVFRLPPELDGDYRELTFVSPSHMQVDGKVWINDSGSYTQLRLDAVTGKFEVFEASPVPRINTYQMLSDSQNNGWFTMFGSDKLGRIDAKTGKVSLYQTPTARSGPRRGMMDAQDRFWFGENRTNKIGMFDTKTEKFQEWAVPSPEFFPYDVAADKNGEPWAITEFSDRVERLNTKTGEFVEYLLPRETNERRSFVDESTTPVTFWVGNTHGASIVKLEPLD